MTKHLTFLLYVVAWLGGQSLYFKSNNGNIIEIKKFRKLQINDIGYRLIKTDYFEKQIIAVKEDVYPGKFGITVASFLIKKDTLSFDSVKSFKYYKKSLKSFSSSILIGTVCGTILGAISTLPFIGGGDDYIDPWPLFPVQRMHITTFWALFGGIGGAETGFIIGALVPFPSDEKIVDNEEWSIIKYKKPKG